MGVELSDPEGVVGGCGDGDLVFGEEGVFAAVTTGAEPIVAGELVGAVGEGGGGEGAFGGEVGFGGFLGFPPDVVHGVSGAGGEQEDEYEDIASHGLGSCSRIIGR